MKILTIIVSYNFEKWIDKCLGSLFSSEYPTEILVVDNCSKDNTVRIIKNKWKNVRLIESSSNLGFGKANNIGFEIAIKEKFDAVFLLNQDAWIDSKTIGTMVETCQKYPEYGILSPIHRSGNGKSFDKGFKSYANLSENSKLPSSDTPIECQFINAAFWFIPVKVLMTVGGFSPLFYHYGEDKDYINRIHFHNYLIGYIPSIEGCHDREYRKVSTESFFHSEYVYFLSEFSNINYNLIKASAYSVLAAIKKAFISLLHGKFNYSIKYASISLRLSAATNKVIDTRKITKQKSNSFLD